MTSLAGESLTYRPYGEDDIPFIRSSWANSYYKGCNDHKGISPEDFHSFHRPLQNRFFDKPTATVIIAHEETEPDIIVGWIAVELISTHILIHYVYIKNTFKGEDLLKSIIDKVNVKKRPVIITHLTDKAKRIIKREPKYQSFIYIPHLT